MADYITCESCMEEILTEVGQHECKSSSSNSESSNGLEHGTPYVLQKQGMYYAHNSRGYVSRVLLAELYTKEYAENYARQCEDVRAIPVTELLTGPDEVQEYIDRLLVMKAACSSEHMEEKMIVDLTVKEIRDLAEATGLLTIVEPEEDMDKDDLETVICLANCHPDGLKNDEGVTEHYSLVMYFEDCPEEGVMPLGDPIVRAP